MRFRITPTDQTFFDLFTQSAQHLVTGAGLLSQLLGADPERRADLAAELREEEHHADDVTHQIIKRLNSTFVTPFDRDDIYELASGIDDCMDLIEESADLIVLYKLDDLPKKVSRQVEILQRAAELTAEAMPKLRSMEDLPEYWVEINRLENQADRAHRSLLAKLFASGSDAIWIMKVKEVIETLEGAADAFEHVANTVETIALKES